MKKRTILLTALMILVGLIARVEAGNLKKKFQKVKSSVVVVQTVSTVASPDPRQKFVSASGLGSGVIISEDGKVLTAAHVIQTADAVSVITADNEMIPATILASAPLADVALIQMERMPTGAVVAEIGDSDKVSVGDEIFVVGAPYGLSYSLTAGHISARHTPDRVMQNMLSVEMFQTDAAINTGNSGGPLFSMDGRVIGIVSYILSRSGGFEGLGFAVTSNVAQKLVIEKKSFWSGVEGLFLTDDLAALFNLPQPAGWLVQRVADNSPASQMGLKGGTIPVKVGEVELLAGGDIVLKVADLLIRKDVEDQSEYQAVFARLRPGESILITVLRAGRVVELKYTKKKPL